MDDDRKKKAALVLAKKNEPDGRADFLRAIDNATDPRSIRSRDYVDEEAKQPRALIARGVLQHSRGGSAYEILGPKPYQNYGPAAEPAVLLDLEGRLVQISIAELAKIVETVQPKKKEPERQTAGDREVAG